MSSLNDRFAAILRGHGQSVTKTRLHIFEQLVGQEPMSMAELVARCQRTDRASVYRSTALFEELGIVQRIHQGWKYKLELSDAFADHHHHLTCVTCGATTAINEDELELFIERMAQQYQFVPKTHQIEVQGTCAACKLTHPAETA